MCLTSSTCISVLRSGWGALLLVVGSCGALLFLHELCCWPPHGWQLRRVWLLVNCTLSSSSHPILFRSWVCSIYFHMLKPSVLLVLDLSIYVFVHLQMHPSMDVLFIHCLCLHINWIHLLILTLEMHVYACTPPVFLFVHPFIFFSSDTCCAHPCLPVYAFV